MAKTPQSWNRKPSGESEEGSAEGEYQGVERRSVPRERKRPAPGYDDSTTDETEDEGDKLFNKFATAGRKGLDEPEDSDFYKIKEEHFLSLLSTLSHGAVSLDENSIVRWWNRGMEKLLGYASSEMMGQHVRALLPKKVRHAHDSWVRQFHSGTEFIASMGGSDNRPIVGVHNDQRLVYMDATLIHVQKGKATHAFAVFKKNTPKDPEPRIQRVGSIENGHDEKSDNPFIAFISHLLVPLGKAFELMHKYFKAGVTTVLLGLFATILTSPAWLSEEKWDRIVALWDDGDEIVQPKVLDSLKPPQRAKTTCKLPNGQAILVDEDTCRTLTRSVEKPAPYEDLVAYRNAVGQMVMVPREAAERLEILNQGVIQDYRSLRQSRAPSVPRGAPTEESIADLLRREEELMEEIRRRLPAEAPQE